MTETKKQDILKTLRSVKLFGTLTEADLTDLAERSELRGYSAGEYIDRPLPCLPVIISGQAAVLGKNSEKNSVVLRQLKSQGLFYSINSWTDVEQLTKDTILTRSLAARFLWNLYHDRRGTLGNAPKYSHQFISSGSPILDVPLDSPDFDAILGSIEKELLDLPDGMNFYPDQPMSGMDFNESIKKIR